MMNFLFRLLLTFNSTSLILVVFLIKEQILIKWPLLNFYIPNYISYLIYLSIPVLTTYISLKISKFLSTDSIIKSSNQNADKHEEMALKNEIELANNSFLPSYLGYFFVALSISNFETLILIFTLIFIFTYYSQALYFNPLFLLFGYHFYYLTTTNRVKLFVITKKSLKNPDEVHLPNLKRINNFTYIDLGR